MKRTFFIPFLSALIGGAVVVAVVAAFGGFLMGGDVLIGVILFSILLVVNFMVITKGSGRIAEVAARFSLDAMPGKQMAIDAELSSGALDEKRAPQPFADAVSALVNLGYAQPQAAAAIAAAVRGAGEGAEAKVLIRLGLRELAK